MTWLEAFVWTCAVETPLYVLLLRGSFRTWWAPVLTSILLQLATHPLLWALFPRTGDYWTSFVVFETGVALVEGTLLALLLWRVGNRRPLRRGLVIGFFVNAVSAAVGLIF